MERKGKPRPASIAVTGLLVILLAAALGMLSGCSWFASWFNRPPVASFSATPDHGPAPLQVTFNGSASHDPDGQIVRFHWDFGDGVQTSGAQAVVVHVYQAAGDYQATLTVTDDQGARGQASTTIRVGQLGNAYRLLIRMGSWGAGEGQLAGPRGLAIVDDTLYIADTGNDRLALFSADGKFIANWGRGGSRLGRFSRPRGIATGPDGTLYIVDSGNQRVQKFSADGHALAAWTIPDAQGLYGIAVAPDGTVYLTDQEANLVYKLNTAGEVLARWGGKEGLPKQFYRPTGVAVAPDGTVYVVDSGNHRVQRLTPAGQVFAIWGHLGQRPGEFSRPTGIAIGPDGAVYIADSQNARVQKFTAEGQLITTWEIVLPGGTQQPFPVALALDRAGNVYVADLANSCVLKFGRD